MRSAKAVPETDYLTQRKQYHKRTTLRTMKILMQSICSKEGLHYCLGAKRKKAVIWQATNAIYGMGTLKNPLQSIRSEEGPHYRLGAKRKEAVIRQATINLFTSLDISWWFHTQTILPSLANASVSLRIFVKKKGMNPVQSNGRSQQTPSAKGGKGKVHR